MITPERQKELEEFIQTGDASDELLAFIEANPDVVKAIELRLRNDETGRLLSDASAEE